MKAGIIYNDYAFRFKTCNKYELAAVIKYITINILLKVVSRKQHLFVESTDDIGTFFCLPSVAINTRFTNRCIDIRSDSFGLKAALIQINNGIALLHKNIELTLISRSFYQARFWML